MKYRVLAINPGSTSTKIAVYDDKSPVFALTLRHDAEKISSFSGIIDQYELRKKIVLSALSDNKIELESLAAVVGRGGLVKPVASGTYIINDNILKDLKNPELWGRIHASNLGAFIARSIADDISVPSYIVDPVTVDEFEDIARVSGFSQITRKSLAHALNLRYCGIITADKIGRKFDETNLIGAHLGGGISVAALRKGRIIDVNNAMLGMGPFSPQRTGALPIGDLLEIAYSGRYTLKELKSLLAKEGGLISYLGTDDGEEISRRISSGDENAELIFDAMCYQISKEIGACAAVLEGDIDRIFITGGLAYNKFVVDRITRRIKFLSSIDIIPGEKEMEALCQGAVRVLKGKEEAKEYTV
jgi:butyrate kinase